MKTIQEQINEKHAGIISAKNDLYDSDYIGHKLIDALVDVLTGPSPTIAKLATAVKGVLADYPGFLEKHQERRAIINNAQVVIKELERRREQEEPDTPEPGEEV